ncbi:hypothetical protein AAFX24_27965 [Vibrio mediterranei]|uniref:hypothetical protein n=1 Tax=Vibrio mediterranei TaxID=689 RepID=UPI0038CE3582
MTNLTSRRIDTANVEVYRDDETSREDYHVSVLNEDINIYMLDEFSKRRLNDDLRRHEHLVVDVPASFMSLTQKSMAAYIQENALYVRISGPRDFITLKFELTTADPGSMNHLLRTRHSLKDLAITFVCQRGKIDTVNIVNLLEEQCNSNRVFNLHPVPSGQDIISVLSSHDKELLAKQGELC